MTSNYTEIYEKFLGLIKEYDFLKLSEEEAFACMEEWMRGVVAKPKVRKLFSSFSVDNDAQTIEYELLKSFDDFSDKGFVEYMLANGMVIGWLTPRVKNNELLTNQYFGAKENQYFSQANHVNAIATIYDTARMVLDKDYVRDHGYTAYLMEQS